jgi:hypothetical protein
MKSIKVIFFIALAVFALSHQSDGQQARPLAEQLRLAGVLPKGALVYLQMRDLGTLMKTWLASPTHEAFYGSASFKNFEKSNIYLKFQDRKKDFETALGFGMDETRLAELAGGASAVAIYDIGNVELAFVTEVGREKAVATELFKNAPQFQERSANGTPYYVREVSTDGGRLNQQFCFAYADGKLIVTTLEGLMIRALTNAKGNSNDAALTDVLELAGKAKGFAARDVTLWLDQTKLNQSRHFKSYWVYDNTGLKSRDSLAKMESGLVDLRFAPEGLNEQRWFKMAQTAQRATALTGEQATAYLRFAPRDAQLVEMHSQSGAELNEAVSLALFGKDFDESKGVAERSEDDSSNSSEADENQSSGGRIERYRKLDARFDQDVDDAQLKPAKQSHTSNSQSGGSQAGGVTKSSPSQNGKGVLANLDAALKSAVSFAELARSKDEPGKPFVHFERAVIVEMKSAVDKAGLEKIISDEMRERFVVAGINPQLSWQDEGAVRFLSQSLLEQGAALAVSGKYLVLASSKEFVRDILQAAATAPATTKIDGAAEFYALVRITDAKPMYEKLMAKLDGKVAGKAKTDSEEEGEPEIKFFSDNLPSFIKATAIREMRVRRNTDGGLLTERIAYSY